MIAIDKSHKKDCGLYAQFDTIKNQTFPLKFSEASTKANPNTKTFRITLKMAASNDYNILPGMTATVVAELYPTETHSSSMIAAPVSAVVADPEKNQPSGWSMKKP